MSEKTGGPGLATATSPAHGQTEAAAWQAALAASAVLALAERSGR